MRKLLTTQPIN